VRFAALGLVEFQPELIISGINHGANLGDDVLYSGTVAAAMEGRFLGVPAIAVSLAGGGSLRSDVDHLNDQVKVLTPLLKRLTSLTSFPRTRCST